MEGPTNTGRAMSSVPPSTPRATSQSINSTFLPAHGSSSNAALAPGNAPPYFCSMVAAKKPPVHLVKMMKARMTAAKRNGGKPTFAFTGQTYLELTETTATVAHVCEQVQKQWGTEYTVVSNKGMEIEDCLATQSKKLNKLCILTLLTLKYRSIFLEKY